MASYYVNGEQSLHCEITDRGLAFGDGVFTTARVINGTIQCFSEHIARLKLSCQRLFIDNVNWERVAIEMQHCASAHDCAVIKMIITAGASGRGYLRNQNTEANRYIFVSELPSFYPQWQEQGIVMGVANTKLGINPSLAGLKHLNRLEQVLIKREVEQSPYDDLLVANINGELIESSIANVFWLRGNDWYTANLYSAGVNGIIRQKVLKHFNFIESVTVSLDDVNQCDAMFITNCLLGVVPVRELNDKILDLASVNIFQSIINHD